MTKPLSYYKYRSFISRKIPCIIYYEKKFSAINKQVVAIMEKMSEKYKLVLCYKVDWEESFRLILNIQKRTPSDVLSFQDSQVTKIVSAFDINELENLFKTVYNDCVTNFIAAINRFLIKNGTIKLGYIHQKFDLPHPSYNIERGNQPFSPLISPFPKEFVGNPTAKHLGNQPKYLKKQNNFIKQTKLSKFKKMVFHEDGSVIVPVASGLPRIEIFLIPLNKVETNYYFDKTTLSSDNMLNNG